MFAFYLRHNDPTGLTRPLPQLVHVTHDAGRANAERNVDLCVEIMRGLRRAQSPMVWHGGSRILEFQVDGVPPPECPYDVDPITWTLKLKPGLSFVGFWGA
jgi:hypothetical protein